MVQLAFWSVEGAVSHGSWDLKTHAFYRAGEGEVHLYHHFGSWVVVAVEELEEKFPTSAIIHELVARIRGGCSSLGNKVLWQAHEEQNWLPITIFNYTFYLPEISRPHT